MVAFLLQIFLLVFAVAVEETVRRKYPDWLAWAWMIVFLTGLLLIATTPWGLLQMAKFGQLIGGETATSYAIVGVIGFVCFVVAWFVINMMLKHAPESVAAENSGQVAGRFVQRGEFSLADNNVIIGSDGSVPDIAQTGKGSILADNLTIVDRQDIGDLFNLVIREIVEIEDMDKSKKGQLINVLAESWDRWKKTGGADIFEDDVELVKTYMPRTRNGETLRKILTSGVGLPTREIWQRRQEEN